MVTTVAHNISVVFLKQQSGKICKSIRSVIACRDLDVLHRNGEISENVTIKYGRCPFSLSRNLLPQKKETLKHLSQNKSRVR